MVGCAPHQRPGASSPGAHSGLDDSGCAADVSSGCSMGSTVSKECNLPSEPALWRARPLEKQTSIADHKSKQEVCNLGSQQAVSCHELQRFPAEGQLVQCAPHKGLMHILYLSVSVQGIGHLYGAALALRPGWHAPQLLQNGLDLVQQALHQPAPLSKFDTT